MTGIRTVAHLVTALRRTARNAAFAWRHCLNRGEVLRSLLSSSSQATVVLRDGTTISAPELRTLLPLIREIFVDHEYVTAHVDIGPGDIVVDIGAHVGVFSLFAAGRGAARVIAFEPSAVNAAYFRRNVAQNNLTGVELVEAAVGASAGTTDLTMSRWSVGNVVPSNIVDAGTGDADAQTIAVNSTSLERILTDYGIDRIDYLKIDSEGSEGTILGAANIDVLHRIDRIALEYHDNWSLLNSVALAQVLANAGFATTSVRTRETFGMIYAWRENA